MFPLQFGTFFFLSIECSLASIYAEPATRLLLTIKYTRYQKQRSLSHTQLHYKPGRARERWGPLISFLSSGSYDWSSIALCSSLSNRYPPVLTIKPPPLIRSTFIIMQREIGLQAVALPFCLCYSRLEGKRECRYVLYKLLGGSFVICIPIDILHIYPWN